MSRGTLLVLAPESDKALQTVLPYAAALADATNTRLRLLAVLSRSPKRGKHLSAELDGSFWLLRRAGAELYLLRACHWIIDRPVEVSVLAGDADPAGDILAAVDDAAIVGLAARSRWDRGLWHRPAIEAAVRRHCRRSVLSVSPCGRPPDRVTFRHIIVPLQGSTVECALKQAVELATASGAQLTLVRVVPWMLRPWYADDPTPALVAGEIATVAAEAYLDQVCAQLPPALHVDRLVCRGTDVAGIAHCVQESGADLVVVGEPNRSAFGRLLHGSAADRLVRAGLPTLIVHPPATTPSAVRPKPAPHPAS
jgi:nucleotide-binding universal stress UspA family protein